MKEYPIPNPEEDTPAGSGYPDTPEENSPAQIPAEGMDVFPEGESPAVPGFSSDERLVSPELSDHISRDEDAYGFHGMPEPGEINQPFDLSVLDDPELDDPEENDAYFSYSPPAEYEGGRSFPGISWRKQKRIFSRTGQKQIRRTTIGKWMTKNSRRFWIPSLSRSPFRPMTGLQERDGPAGKKERAFLASRIFL